MKVKNFKGLEHIIPITKENFHIASSAVFLEIDEPLGVEPSYISKNAEGEPHSWYWFGKDEGGEYVIRKSNHWGVVKDCDWDLVHGDFILVSNPTNKHSCKDSINKNNFLRGFAVAKCYFADFDWNK